MRTKVDDLIGWLYEVANSLDWRVSVLDILETEKRYPGVMDDLSTEAWQRKLIKDQLEATGKPKEAVAE